MMDFVSFFYILFDVPILSKCMFIIVYCNKIKVLQVSGLNTLSMVTLIPNNFILQSQQGKKCMLLCEQVEWKSSSFR